MLVSRDLVNHKKMVVTQNRFQKTKEHGKNSKMTKSEPLGTEERDFIDVQFLKKK